MIMGHTPIRHPLKHEKSIIDLHRSAGGWVGGCVCVCEHDVSIIDLHRSAGARVGGWVWVGRVCVVVCV